MFFSVSSWDPCVKNLLYILSIKIFIFTLSIFMYFNILEYNYLCANATKITVPKNSSSSC